MKITQRKALLVVLTVSILSAVYFVVPQVRQIQVTRETTELMRKHRFKAALHTMDRWVTDADANADLLLLKARCCRHLGDRDRFESLVAAAESRGAAPIDTQRERTLLRVQYGDLKNAGQLFAAQILNGSEHLSEICEAFATGFLLSGRAVDALSVLNAWAADFPEDAQAALLMGESYHQLQDPNQAAAMFRRATELDDGRWELQLAAAQGYTELMDYQAALPYFESCLQLISQEPESQAVPTDSLHAAVNGKARCLVATGQADQAIAALNQYPTALQTADALLIQGRVAMLNNDPASAVELLQAALDSRRWDTEIRSLLANSLNACGRQEDAQIHFQYLARAAPELQTLESCLTAVRDDPANADLRFQIADIMLNYSDPVEGRTWLLSCLAIAPDHEGARRLLAKTEDP